MSKDAAAVAVRVAAAYRRVQETGMRDVPICNPALDVAAVGFRRREGAWIGVLVTPWSMNLLRLPVHSEAGARRTAATTRTLRLPSGEYEFLACYNADIGHHETCSLFSPVLQFADQAAAVATANAVLALVLDERMAGLAGAQTTAPRPVTRRALLRAILGVSPA